MKIVDTLSLSLSLAPCYKLFRFLVLRDGTPRTLVRDYFKPFPGAKILDIGCGPADILNHLENVRYTGIDHSAKYIDSAKKRFGNRGRFLCGDLGGISIEAEHGTFDLVIAIGVLHHLNDDQAIGLFDLARHALKPTGRLLTYDGCYLPGQSRIARWLLSKDRGKFVRTRLEYERLASARFSNLESHLRDDLLRIPYSHTIMCCSN